MQHTCEEHAPSQNIDSTLPTIKDALELYPRVIGVDEGIVCLPVHDAIAVQRRNELWVVRTMISTWTEVVGCDVNPTATVDKAA